MPLLVQGVKTAFSQRLFSAWIRANLGMLEKGTPWQACRVIFLVLQQTPLASRHFESITMLFTNRLSSTIIVIRVCSMSKGHRNITGSCFWYLHQMLANWCHCNAPNDITLGPTRLIAVPKYEAPTLIWPTALSRSEDACKEETNIWSNRRTGRGVAQGQRAVGIISRICTDCECTWDNRKANIGQRYPPHPRPCIFTGQPALLLFTTTCTNFLLYSHPGEWRIPVTL